MVFSGILYQIENYNSEIPIAKTENSIPHIEILGGETKKQQQRADWQASWITMNFQRPYSAHNSSHTVAEITGHNTGCVPLFPPTPPFFPPLCRLNIYIQSCFLSNSKSLLPITPLSPPVQADFDSWDGTLKKKGGGGTLTTKMDGFC